MSNFKIDAQMYEYENEEFREEIIEAATRYQRKRPFTCAFDFDDISREDLILACMELIEQRAQYREAMLDASQGLRNRCEDIG